MYKQQLLNMYNQANCTTGEYRILKFKFFHDFMGKNIKKQSSSYDKSWERPKSRSVNASLIRTACNFKVSNFLKKNKWKYVATNTEGIDFYIDYSNIYISGQHLMFWHLQNKNKVDKWGSRSVAILRELNCGAKKFRSIKFSYYYGSMGKELEKTVDAINDNW